MSQLEEMKATLLRLALTTNGRTTSWDASGGGERDYTPRLGHSDAPHLFHAARWDAACGDVERAAALEAAKDELDQILRSRGRVIRGETRAELERRVLAEGKGWAARDVATRLRTSVRVVHAARAAAGRDLEFGELPRADVVEAAERRAAVERLTAGGRMSVRQAAFTLGMSYATARRALGRKA